MNSNPLVTSGLTVGVADLVPTVNWVIGGCHGMPPANLSTLIAGGVVLVLHAAYNWLVARAAKPATSEAKSATPA